MLATVSRALSMIGLVAASLAAEVVQRGAFASRCRERATFGTAGPSVDPTLPANRIVTDIDKAPRNATGRSSSIVDGLVC